MSTQATYRAEVAFLRDETIHFPLLTTFAEVEAFLAKHAVSPVLLSRMTFAKVRGSDEGSLHFLGWDQWMMRLAMPAHPMTALHEAAHLLIESIGGNEKHDLDFRQTLIWLVKMYYGTRASERLARKYYEEGL